jgi:hypothetical protein
VRTCAWPPPAAWRRPATDSRSGRDDGAGDARAAAPDIIRDQQIEAAAYADGFAWIADRFAGEPAVSTCP